MPDLAAYRNRIARSVAGIRADERGSIIPLALGLFLLAFVFVGGAIAFSDVFTKQRDLQAVCDGAAVAAASNLDRAALHGGTDRATGSDSTVPLAEADQLVRVYLARDQAGTATAATTSLSPDANTIAVTCRRHNRVAFGALILRGGGVDQTAYASAQTRLNP